MYCIERIFPKRDWNLDCDWNLTRYQQHSSSLFETRRKRTQPFPPSPFPLPSLPFPNRTRPPSEGPRQVTPKALDRTSLGELQLTLLYGRLLQRRGGGEVM